VILSDREIRDAIKAGRIGIDPEPEAEQYTSSALDLRLGQNFFQWIPQCDMDAHETPGLERPVVINPTQILEPHILFRRCLRKLPTEPDGSFDLKPRAFVLAETQERIELPLGSKLAARVEGRSTLARCGLMVHLTAPTIHEGFAGIIVLEMCNFGEHPIKLVPGGRYCQLVFERLGTKPGMQPATKYQKQRTVRP
jgi:dCTP deaminase